MPSGNSAFLQKPASPLTSWEIRERLLGSGSWCRRQTKPIQICSGSVIRLRSMNPSRTGRKGKRWRNGIQPDQLEETLGAELRLLQSLSSYPVLSPRLYRGLAHGKCRASTGRKCPSDGALQIQSYFLKSSEDRRVDRAHPRHGFSTTSISSSCRPSRPRWTFLIGRISALGTSIFADGGSLRNTSSRPEGSRTVVGSSSG